MFQLSGSRRADVGDLCLSVIQGLRQIDEEALPVEGDYPTAK
jgi:hypothetical protein